MFPPSSWLIPSFPSPSRLPWCFACIIFLFVCVLFIFDFVQACPRVEFCDRCLYVGHGEGLIVRSRVRQSSSLTNCCTRKGRRGNTCILRDRLFVFEFDCAFAYPHVVLLQLSLILPTKSGTQIEGACYACTRTHTRAHICKQACRHAHIYKCTCTPCGCGGCVPARMPLIPFS